MCGECVAEFAGDEPGGCDRACGARAGGILSEGARGKAGKGARSERSSGDLFGAAWVGAAPARKLYSIAQPVSLRRLDPVGLARDDGGGRSQRIPGGGGCVAGRRTTKEVPAPRYSLSGTRLPPCPQDWKITGQGWSLILPRTPMPARRRKCGSLS